MKNVLSRFKDYEIKKITEKEIDDVLALCKPNVEYYNATHAVADYDDVRKSMTMLPRNTQLNQRYFVGLYKDSKLVAILDIIDGYPRPKMAFIGLFMLDVEYQGKGIGKSIIKELLTLLNEENYQECRLGVVQGVKRSYAFWTSLGFQEMDLVIDAGDYNIVMLSCNIKELNIKNNCSSKNL